MRGVSLEDLPQPAVKVVCICRYPTLQTAGALTDVLEREGGADCVEHKVLLYRPSLQLGNSYLLPLAGLREQPETGHGGQLVRDGLQHLEHGPDPGPNLRPSQAPHHAPERETAQPHAGVDQTQACNLSGTVSGACVGGSVKGDEGDSRDPDPVADGQGHGVPSNVASGRHKGQAREGMAFQV